MEMATRVANGTDKGHGVIAPNLLGEIRRERAVAREINNDRPNGSTNSTDVAPKWGRPIDKLRNWAGIERITTRLHLHLSN